MSHRNTFYYDQASNVTCVRDDDLGLTYHTYDLLNRATSLKNPFGEVTYYEYLDCGQVGKRTLGNGCLTYYEYDVKGRVTKIDERESDMTQLSELQYEYDKVGNPIKIEREDGSATYYEYDRTYQLTDEVQVDDQTQVEYDFAYEYDGAHNRTVKVDDGTPTYYTYNAANQMLTETTLRQGFGGQATGAATTYYHYDGCGNTTAKQAPAGGHHLLPVRHREPDDADRLPGQHAQLLHVRRGQQAGEPADDGRLLGVHLRGPGHAEAADGARRERGHQGAVHDGQRAGGDAPGRG
jgi:YD repeat-containing protein